MNRQNTTIRMDTALKAKTKSLAALQQRSLSDLIEEALLFKFPELSLQNDEQAAA